MNDKINDNQYLDYSLLDLRIEISKRQLQTKNGKWSFDWIAVKLGKTKATVSYVLNDTGRLSPKAKARIRKRICTLLSSKKYFPTTIINSENK